MVWSVVNLVGLMFPVSMGLLPQAGTEEPERVPSEPVRVLIMSDLTESPAALVSLDERTVTVRAGDSGVRTLPRERALAFVPVLGPRESAATTMPEERAGWWVVLADGQTYPGTVGQPTKDEALAWQTPLWGSFETPLEEVRSVAQGAPAAHSGAVAPDDRVLLANRDTAAGFVESITTEGVALERSGEVGTVPWERVASVTLANAPVEREGVWLWFFDGTIAKASSVQAPRREELRLTGSIPGAATQPEGTTPGDSVSAIALDAAALRPLAAMERTVIPAETRRWTPEPVVGAVGRAPLGAADIDLPGPMAVEWVLPAGAAGLTATFELPESARVWGDCEVVIEDAAAGAELFRARLNGENPRVQARSLFEGVQRLRVRVLEGERGPIQDYVVLRRALVLVRPAGS